MKDLFLIQPTIYHIKSFENSVKNYLSSLQRLSDFSFSFVNKNAKDPLKRRSKQISGKEFQTFIGLLGMLPDGASDSLLERNYPEYYLEYIKILKECSLIYEINSAGLRLYPILHSVALDNLDTYSTQKFEKAILEYFKKKFDKYNQPGKEDKIHKFVELIQPEERNIRACLVRGLSLGQKPLNQVMKEEVKSPEINFEQESTPRKQRISSSQSQTELFDPENPDLYNDRNENSLPHTLNKQEIVSKAKKRHHENSKTATKRYTSSNTSSATTQPKSEGITTLNTKQSQYEYSVTSIDLTRVQVETISESSLLARYLSLAIHYASSLIDVDCIDIAEFVTQCACKLIEVHRKYTYQSEVNKLLSRINKRQKTVKENCN